MKFQNAILIIMLFSAAGCAKPVDFAVPELADQALVQEVAYHDLAETVPAYGIALDQGVLEVNIEAHDSGKVRAGQEAWAAFPPLATHLACRVTRVLKAASAETGQSLAWLQAVSPSGVVEREFVFAGITALVRRHVLAVPRQALLVRGGKNVAVRQEGDGAGGEKNFLTVEVKTGVVSDSWVEIVAGLKAGDRVVVQGGVGYLDPSFKANAVAN